MTIIGTFKKIDDSFNGTLATLTLNRAIDIRPVERKTEQGPDYRAYAMGAEIGAGWLKSTEGKKQYLSLKLDDPSFAAPLHCRLIAQDDGGYLLLWSR